MLCALHVLLFDLSTIVPHPSWAHLYPVTLTSPSRTWALQRLGAVPSGANEGRLEHPAAWHVGFTTSLSPGRMCREHRRGLFLVSENEAFFVQPGDWHVT